MHKSIGSIAISFSVAVAAVLPAAAQMGSSEKICPGTPEYYSGSAGSWAAPPADGGGMVGGGGMTPDQALQQLGLQGMGGGASSGGYNQPMLEGNLQQNQYAMPAQNAGFNQQMQYAQPMQQAQDNSMQYAQPAATAMNNNEQFQGSGIVNEDMSIPAVDMSGSNSGAGVAGGGMGQIMAAASMLGLVGSSGLNMLGGSMRQMGFGGGFTGRAMGANRNGGYNLTPLGGSGLYRGGGGSYYSSSGGGGGYGRGLERTINRAVDRNVRYAADQATSKLIRNLWR